MHPSLESRLRIMPAMIILLAGLVAYLPARATTLVGSEDMVSIPVDELVSLLEQRWRQGDTTALAKLALTHTLAYALETEAARVRKSSPESGWFHYVIDPFANAVSTAAPLRQQRAAAHLEPAKALYLMALAEAPDSYPLRFEYARLLDHSGDRQQAIVQYRRIIELQALEPSDRDTVLESPRAESMRIYAAIVASHLIPLLDPTRDAQEILRLRRLRVVAQ